MAYTDQDPQDILTGFLSGNMSANDPVKLAGLRNRRIDELQTHINQADSPSAAHVLQGYIEQLKGDAKSDPYTGDIAHQHQADTEKALYDAALDQRPEIKQYHDAALADKIALATAAPNATAQGNLAVAKQQGQNELLLQQQKQAPAEEIIRNQKTGNLGGAPGSTLKRSINANGEVSFTEQPMSPMIQKSVDSLSSARTETHNALAEMERMYPGINDAAAKAETSTAPQSFFSELTGVGAQPFSGPAARGAIAKERLKYWLGMPTPITKMVQEGSFGNISQMAGQIPGVRGLAGIANLFKEHQASIGHEDPIVSVQRLRGMAKMEDDTIQQIQSGGADFGSQGPQ